MARITPSKRDVVLLNAGIALYVAEQVESIKHGVEGEISH